VEESKLEKVPLFAGLSRDELRRLASVTDEITVPAGTRLIHEGAFAHEFLLICSGGAEVARGGAPLASLGPGDFAGEIGAIRDVRRNATVTASSDLKAIVMTARDLRHVVAEMPSVGAQIDAAIAERSGEARAPHP
jgi:CRP/FNR family transcriptional regulator, cyclic AMP receptor protein